MHIETVTLLSQRESKDETVVSFENKKATKAETKPTYNQIKEYVMEKYVVKVSSLDVANAKNEFGLKERENYNLPKSEYSRRPNLTSKKKKMIALVNKKLTQRFILSTLVCYRRHPCIALASYISKSRQDAFR